MNRQEYLKIGRPKNTFWRFVHTELIKWKTENNTAERCLVHHRDDTEETRKYNEEHYERWGFNEDGTFEYGKYVVFMTATEHSAYHIKGERNPNYGKKLSDEHCAKISAAHKGKMHSKETRTKLSTAQKGNNNSMYGKHHSEETRTKMSLNHADFSGKENPMYGKKHSEEARAKMLAAQKGISTLYTTYKENGGILKWKDFRKALSNGEITFEVQPITVYTRN